MSEKPILFNTEMVKAILEGRKTVTRRVIKLKYGNTHIEWKEDKYGKRLIELQNDVEGETHGRREDGTTWRKLLVYRELKSPYQVGDVLYVRETFDPEYWPWQYKNGRSDLYKADYEMWKNKSDFSLPRWKPSIHMPKEAARIFLRVTKIKPKQLQDITDKEARAEGVNPATNNSGIAHQAMFMKIWDSTIPKKDLKKYGWNANPWVWVIEFERVGNPILSSITR